MKRHGLQVYMRNPSSYTPLRSEFQNPGGPKSLTLGMNEKENYEEIKKFSEKDASMYEKYEAKLSKFVDVSHTAVISEILIHAQLAQAKALA